MNKFTSLRSKAALSAVIVAMSLVAAPASSASATGQYDYVCVGQDGNTWSMRQGEKTTDCKGAFLQKYIDGKKVATYRLTTAGTVTTKKPDVRACILAIIGTVATVYASWKNGGSVSYYSRASLGSSWIACIVGK